jgi:hypothetical protein
VRVLDARKVEPSLEDVFVAVIEGRRSGAPAPEAARG